MTRRTMTRTTMTRAAETSAAGSAAKARRERKILLIKDNACDSAFCGGAKERKTLYLPEDGRARFLPVLARHRCSCGGDRQRSCAGSVFWSTPGSGASLKNGRVSVMARHEGSSCAVTTAFHQKNAFALSGHQCFRSRRFFKRRSYLLFLTYAERMTA